MQYLKLHKCKNKNKKKTAFIVSTQEEMLFLTDVKSLIDWGREFQTSGRNGKGTPTISLSGIYRGLSKFIGVYPTPDG